MPSIVTITFILTDIIFLGILFFLFWRGRKQDNPSSMLMLQQQIQELRGVFDNRLGDSVKMFQQQSDKSARIIVDITERLTRLDETNRQVVNFAEQLQSLEDILQNPKQRGVLDFAKCLPSSAAVPQNPALPAVLPP